MEPEEFTIPTSSDPLERLLERLQLCTEVIQEVHYLLEQPTEPDDKADLLIAVEALTFETIDLLQTTKTYVWGEESNEDESDKM
jgi:hypothetical protein